MLTRKPPWYRFLDRGEMPGRLVHISADLLDAQISPTGLSLSYSSPGKAVILLNQEPMEIQVDGQRSGLTAQRAGGNWWLVSPRGRHRIDFTTTSQAGAVVNLWSWLSASAIVAFGALATSLMTGIYVLARIRRRLRTREAA